MKIYKYFTAFFKFYLWRKPKLILTIILTIIIFIWINNIYNNFQIISAGKYSPPSDIIYLIRSGNLFLLFIKPIFTYIAGLFIIKHI